MKKTFLLFIIFCLTINLTACGNNDSNQKPEFPENGSIAAKTEILDATWDSGLIQVNDRLVQFPIHLNDWVALGFDYIIDGGLTAKDFVFTNDKTETIAFSLLADDSLICDITLEKESDMEGTLEELNPLIEQIAVKYQPENAILYFPGGLTFRDSYLSIQETLGLPTEIYSYNYTYGQIGTAQTDLSYGLQVRVNDRTQLICGFVIGKSITANACADLTRITLTNVSDSQTSDVHSISLLWAPNYKQTSRNTTSPYRIESVLDYEGQKYLMSLSLSMSASPNTDSHADYEEPILDQTDENGFSRRVYRTDESYVIVCEGDTHTLEATICFRNIINPAEDALTLLEDLALEIAGSVQY